MHIGLHDAEFDHLKGKTFPNLALMKISAFHKAQGHTVSWWTPVESNNFDAIYSSKVFDFTPEHPYLPPNTIKGGTGYSVKSSLHPAIDAMPPDYSIYPDCDYAVGFLTRGCPNSCAWCVVPEKEGNIKPYLNWRVVIRPDSNKIVLMDNNILASEYGIQQLESIAGSGYELDINQGMDARYFNKRIADICADIKWIRYIRFSCDTQEQIGSVLNAIDLLAQRGIKPNRIYIYLLVTSDIQNAAERVEALKVFGGIRLFAQAERNTKKGITPNPAQIEFAQRYVYGASYRNETWLEYCKKRNFDPGKMEFKR